MKITLPIHTVKVLAKRDLFSALRGSGLYVVSSVLFLSVAFIVKNYLDSIKKNDVFISHNPLSSAFFIPMVIVSVYLALVSAASISREKDQGTLEVLFYGPVSYFSYIIGKYINGMLNYLVVVGFFFIYFLGISNLTNLGFSYRLVEAIFMSIFSVSCVISFGLLISSFTRRIRSSILWLVGIFLLFLGIQLSHTILLGMPETTMSSVLVYFEKSLSMISKYVIGWLSPFSYVNRGMEAVSLSDLKLYGMNIIYCIIYSIVLLSLSMFILEKKGIKG